MLLVSHRQSTMRISDAVYSAERLSRTEGRAFQKEKAIGEV